MRRFYYFGCRGRDAGHFIHGDIESSAHRDTLDNQFPVHVLDETFAPITRADRRWRLTHIRYGGHVMSILACHDNSIDKRPGSNAAFIVVDSLSWDTESILDNARTKFPDCFERLKDVPRPEEAAQ
jgi:hypothetical protein